MSNPQLRGGRSATRAETAASIRADAIKTGLAWGAVGIVLGGAVALAAPTKSKPTVTMAAAGAIVLGTFKGYRHWKRESWVLDAFYGPEQTESR